MKFPPLIYKGYAASKIIKGPPLTLTLRSQTEEQTQVLSHPAVSDKLPTTSHFMAETMVSSERDGGNDRAEFYSVPFGSVSPRRVPSLTVSASVFAPEGKRGGDADYSLTENYNFHKAAMN